MLNALPGAWVAAQSEIAFLPTYLESELVGESLGSADADTEFGHLLHHENYVFLDIPAVVSLVITNMNSLGLMRPSQNTVYPQIGENSGRLIYRCIAWIGRWFR
jgi:hypothetical protein